LTLVSANSEVETIGIEKEMCLASQGSTSHCCPVKPLTEREKKIMRATYKQSQFGTKCHLAP